MPPKKKKQPRNGFYYYMLDVKDELQETDHRTYTMGEISELAGPGWRELTNTEKKHYEDRAKQAKANQGGGEGKRDTYGNLIEDNTRREEEKREQEKLMNAHIERIISEDLGHMELIRKEPFYFMSTSFFCITEEGVYVPAEIAMARYSLEEGILNEFHSFIDPGPIPTGYTFVCKDASESLHIPYCNFERATSDYDGIMRGIEDLLTTDGLQGDFPIVYCCPEEITHCKNILKWLQKDGRTRRIIQLRLYDVSVLFSALFRFIEKPMSALIAYEYLNTTIYTYQLNTCCQYHWDTDYPLKCVLGNVKRYGFVFSNYLCCDYGGVIVPGRHIPINPSSNHTVRAPGAQRSTAQRPSSAASVCSTSSRSTVWSEPPRCASKSNPWSMPSVAPKAPVLHDDSMGGFIVKKKSQYDTSPDYPQHTEASAASSFSEQQSSVSNLTASFSQQASVSDDRARPSPSGLVPLRQPRGQSFAEKISMSRSRPAPQVMDADSFPSLGGGSFPSLGANSRSASVLSGYTSDVSLGLPSNASESSYSSANFYSSRATSSVPESATPVGRGIGRGGPYVSRPEVNRPGWGMRQ